MPKTSSTTGSRIKQLKFLAVQYKLSKTLEEKTEIRRKYNIDRLFPSKIVCKNCGSTWGDHSGLLCLDNGLFYPVE